MDDLKDIYMYDLDNYTETELNEDENQANVTEKIEDCSKGQSLMVH